MSKINIFALGGLNENGKNMYVIEVDYDIFVFEAGLKYASDDLLGIDYMIPNYDYLIENQHRIRGLFITHGHDEQMGAISDILHNIPNLKIFAGKFTVEMIKQDLEEDNVKCDYLNTILPHHKYNFGKNSIYAIQVSHALPDSYMYVLDTQDGSIVFTGNYVFDPSMKGPYKMDIGELATVGKQGVLCLMSESLYAEKKGFTSPQHRAENILRDVLNKNEGRILLNIFETQVYRIQEMFNEIAKTKRNVVIMGKNLENIILKSIDMGLIKFQKYRIKTIHHVKDEGIIVLISNEREKPYSSLKRILRNSDKFITLNEEDTVVIASPIYDGIEMTSTKIFNDIAKIGSNLIILSKKYLSPHASSEDLMMMINLMNPKYYFPVNGEYRNQVENANVAKKAGINDNRIIISLNGDVTTFLNGNRIYENSKIKVDDILIDGKDSSDIGDLVLKDRELLSEDGIVVVTSTLRKIDKEILSNPQVHTKGFIYVKDNLDLIKESEDICLKILKDNIKYSYVDFNKIKMGIREQLGKFYYQKTGCKPMIIIVMQEI